MQQQGTNIAWAANSTTGYSTNITTLVATKVSGSNATDAVFSGDGATDGSESLTKLKGAVSDYSETNYPAWYFVENYAANEGLTGEYASGWYMPSVQELCTLYQNKGIVNIALEKITGAAQISTANAYWSSSQDGSNASYAWYVGSGRRMVCSITTSTTSCRSALSGSLTSRKIARIGQSPMWSSLFHKLAGMVASDLF